MAESSGVLDIHEALGGTAGWRRLAETFYGRVAHDPVLRPLFPGKSFHCAVEELTAFLTQLFRGSGKDTQRRWWLSIQESHARFRIGADERAAWMKNMVLAIEELGLEAPVRSELLALFEESSSYVVNLQRAEPVQSALRADVACRWQGQVELDNVVAAVRSGDEKAILDGLRHPQLVARLESDRSTLVGLLAMMADSSSDLLTRVVHERIARDPGLMSERCAGRTLLHGAAAQGNLGLADLLLGLGADVDARDGGQHTPLYSAANECGRATGAPMIRLLVANGADVDACEGAKRCSALHMAARRGHVAIAEALLDCGAAIEARDSGGDTPLRRAVNCGKAEVAAVLLARGANRHSRGSKNLTPITAARTDAMKAVFGRP